MKVEATVRSWIAEKIEGQANDADVDDLVKRIKTAQRRILAVRLRGWPNAHCVHLLVPASIDVDREREQWERSGQPRRPSGRPRVPDAPVPEAPKGFVDWLKVNCRAEEAGEDDVKVVDLR